MLITKKSNINKNGGKQEESWALESLWGKLQNIALHSALLNSVKGYQKLNKMSSSISV